MRRSLVCALHAVGRNVECLEAESQSAHCGAVRAAGGADSDGRDTDSKKDMTAALMHEYGL